MISNWRRLLPLLAETFPPLRPTDTHSVLMRAPPLPPEILDLIVDHLRDEPKALKACCVVSKSWIHRARTHLFASIQFVPTMSPIELWKKAFPDPPSSPAHHTRHLFICGPSIVAATYPDLGDWTRTFHNLVHLRLEPISSEDRQVSLAPFHGLSPTLKSLSLTSISLEVLDLICSFPLLEDLALIFPTHASDVWNTPSTSPKLTGSLDLKVIESIRPAARQLLDLPGGLHFAKITIACFKEDVESTMGLVLKCSDTLESLTISYYAQDASGKPPLDLSKATKLKELSFRCGGPTIQRITMALRTVRSRNLQQITIHLYTTSANLITEAVRQEWQDLDRLLLQFWTSHSICPKITYEVDKRGDDLRASAPGLLPELTKRGLVDLVKNRHPYPMGPLLFILA